MPQQGKTGFDEDEIVTPAPSQSQKPIGAKETPGFDEDPVVPPDEDKPPPPPPDPNKPKPIPQMTEFGQTLWEEGVKGIPVGIYQTIRHPWDTAKAMGEAEWSEFTRAYNSAKEGHWWDAAGYTAAGLAPVAGAFFGPAGVLAGFALGQGGSGLMEDIESGHYGRGAAHALMLGGPELLKLLELGPIVKAGRAGPEVERALQAEEKAGTPLSVGQKQRNLRVQKRERLLTNFEGKAGERATEFFDKQTEALRQRSEGLAGKVSPKVYDAEDAGNTVKTRLNTRGSGYKQTSQKFYAQVEAKTAQAKQTLPNGPPQRRINPKTKKPYTYQPTKTFEAPVDIRSMQAQLRPIFDEFQHAWAQNPRLQASPGYVALRNLIDTKDWYMNAVDLDQTLSAVKSLTRNGTSKILTPPSGRIAKAVINAGETELNKTFAAIDPTLKATLTKARTNWKSYVDTSHLNEWLGDNGGEAFKKLTKSGFGSLDELREIKRLAPQEVPNIARAHLQELLSKSTTMGGFDKTASLLNDWENGTQLKVRQELYGVQMESEIHDFFRAAKYLNPAEGSQTAGRFAALRDLMQTPAAQGTMGAAVGVGAEMLYSLYTGQGGLGGPLIPLAAAAGAFYKTKAMPYVWSKLLFTPGGARLATQALRLPLGSKPWIRTLQILGVRSMAIEQAHREDERNRQQMKGEGGKGGRPAETPVGGGRGGVAAAAAPQGTLESPGVPRTSPITTAGEKPSPVGPPTEAPEGQEAAPSQTPTRSPGTATGAGVQSPPSTTVSGWPTGGAPPVMPTPQGGTRPQATPPQNAPPAQGGAAVQPIPQGPQSQPPPGTNWRYWGLEPPAGQPDRTTPAARPPARPGVGGAPARPAPGMARWQSLFQQVGQSMGVPPGLLATVAQLESGGNEKAVGTSGEHGLFQLMPETARTLKVDPRDPQQAARGAATLLRHLMTKYRGDIRKVLAAYNEGETKFDRRMRLGLPLPSVTQAYVRKGLALMARGQQPSRAVAAGGGAD